MKELEDYNWFPAALRRWQMEFIGSVAVWTKLYKPIATLLDKMIAENKIIALQDTCSGSGVPALYVHQQLHNKIPLLLTDKYPVLSFENKSSVSYSVNSVDALKMQPVDGLCYTMYNSFHHFTNEQQQSFINKLAAANAPFLVAEILEPGIINVVKIFLTGMVLQLFIAPFIKPMSFGRLFFTYIIPVNLFTVTYDGIISVLKSKTVQQYKTLLKNSSTQNFTITVNNIKNWKGNVVYIKGQPNTI